MSILNIYVTAIRLIKENPIKMIFIQLLYILSLLICVLIDLKVFSILLRTNPKGVFPFITNPPLSGLSLFIIVSLVIYMVLFYFSIGGISFFLKISREEETSISELFSLKKNFLSGFFSTIIAMIIIGIVEGILAFVASILGLQVLATIITIALNGTVDAMASNSMMSVFCVLIISAVLYIILSLGYSQIPFVYLDSPNSSPLRIISDSWDIMRGNKFRLLFMLFGFVIVAFIIVFVGGILGRIKVIGKLFSIITLLILVLYELPFALLSLSLFYDSIKNGKTMNRRTIADKRGEELEEIVQQIGREARGE